MTNADDGGFWDRRRVLVTGATGIVGSWLVREILARGACVVALIRDADPQSELFRSGDISRIAAVNGRLEDFRCVERAINEHEIETVFHLGAQTIVGTAFRAPLPTFETNIRGSYNVLEACRVHRDLVRRLVVASSDKAYGEQISPYLEDMPLAGRSPYDVSKSCADLLAQSYHHSYALPVAIARCGNVYGGGDLNWSRIVPGTIRSLALGQRPVVRSDGTYVREYLFVQDAVRAYLQLAEGLDRPEVAGQAFNFSAESPLSVLELVAEISRLMDRADLEPEILNVAEGEIVAQRLSATKARAVLGWRPEYDLTRGLRETINWYRRFLGVSNPASDTSHIS
jgi:CDP-glucose 4,6-dehydratase